MGMASAIFNLLNDHVIVSFPQELHVISNQWSTYEFTSGKNGEMGHFFMIFVFAY